MGDALIISVLHPSFINIGLKEEEQMPPDEEEVILFWRDIDKMGIMLGVYSQWDFVHVSDINPGFVTFVGDREP